MVTAFIPVRGGSKSIPLKNIKPLCGKPLVYWCLNALEYAASVDEIVVATDSDQIEDTVIGFHFSKVKIYRRSAENAVDTASTESVMLEYLNYAKLDADCCFVLVQATSPLTQTEDFESALSMFKSGRYDSILTCVRNLRFFWNPNGTSMNYDYRNRPRRQDFTGMLMENGAFYINTVKNILATGNRLSGKIGIYEMPEFTAAEIDEPDDWMYIEQLMKRHILLTQRKSTAEIKLFLSDVDGVLTDGGMYYSERGDELKKFNTRDGMAFQLLREAGIKTGLITSERTDLVSRRAQKLELDYCVQYSKNGGKLQAAQDICRELGISLAEVAYVGDDINCYEPLAAVGFAFCPLDAAEKVRDIPGIITVDRNGGDGVVRKIVDHILGGSILRID